MSQPRKSKSTALVAEPKGSLGLRRQAVLGWMRAGAQGDVAALARALRSTGVTVGLNPDGTPHVVKVHATTPMLYKDIAAIRQRWRENEEYSWSKEEYRDRLLDLYARAYRIATTGGTREKLVAIEECRKLLQQIGQLDGHWTREQQARDEGLIARLEVGVLRKALAEKDGAVIEAEAEIIE